MWALVNLVLSVAGLILAIVVVVCVLLQHKKKQKKSQASEEPKKQKNNHFSYWLVAALVMGVAGIVVFLLTEDMTHPMGLVDNWTIL
jgi:heme/copper-type cytochrome/quinol oxidase subunit 2